MAHEGETFFTAIGCMDGRVQTPIKRFGQRRFGVKYKDTLTEAGLVGLLSSEEKDEALHASIRKKLLVSVEKHHSKGIVVHGHQECAGNPVEDQQHKKDIKKATKVIKDMLPDGVSIPVIPVFVKRRGKGWTVEEL